MDEKKAVLLYAFYSFLHAVPSVIVVVASFFLFFITLICLLLRRGLRY